MPRYRYDIDYTDCDGKSEADVERQNAQIKSEAQRIGGEIYMEALSDRRGFRNDQIGIYDDFPIWREIFEDIGRVAIEQLQNEGGDGDG